MQTAGGPPIPVGELRRSMQGLQVKQERPVQPAVPSGQKEWPVRQPSNAPSAPSSRPMPHAEQQPQPQPQRPVQPAVFTGLQPVASVQGGPGKKPKKKRRSRRVIGCNCKKSKCLKLYCDCFAKQVFCGADCKCVDCYNTEDDRYEEKRHEAIQATLDRNAHAFFRAPDTGFDWKGCKCKRSNCLKFYCECARNGMACIPECRCSDCHNAFGAKPNYNFGVPNKARARLQAPLASAAAAPAPGSARIARIPFPQPVITNQSPAHSNQSRAAPAPSAQAHPSVQAHSQAHRQSHSQGQGQGHSQGVAAAVPDRWAPRVHPSLSTIRKSKVSPASAAPSPGHGPGQSTAISSSSSCSSSSSSSSSSRAPAPVQSSSSSSRTSIYDFNPSSLSAGSGMSGMSPIELGQGMGGGVDPMADDLFGGRLASPGANWGPLSSPARGSMMTSMARPSPTRASSSVSTSTMGPPAPKAGGDRRDAFEAEMRQGVAMRRLERKTSNGSLGSPRLRHSVSRVSSGCRGSVGSGVSGGSGAAAALAAASTAAEKIAGAGSKFSADVLASVSALPASQLGLAEPRHSDMPSLAAWGSFGAAGIDRDISGASMGGDFGSLGRMTSGDLNNMFGNDLDMPTMPMPELGRLRSNDYDSQAATLARCRSDDFKFL